MKLFDTIFHLLIDKGGKITPNTDTEIFAIKSGKSIFLYLNFEFNQNHTYASEQHHPTKEQLKEYLGRFILNEDPRASEIEKFLNKNLEAEKNPLKNGDSLKSILEKEEPLLCKRIRSNANLLEAAIDLIVEKLEEKASTSQICNKLGRGDKETYEEFWYEDGKFHYQEGDTLAYGHPDFKQTFESKEELKKFFKDRGWVGVKDGIVCGRGSITSFIPFWLEELKMQSLYDYIEARQNKAA